MKSLGRCSHDAVARKSLVTDLCSRCFAEPCVYEAYPGAAMSPLPRTYRQRQPQSTVLHRIARENLETFLVEGRQRSASGEGYPL